MCCCWLDHYRTIVQGVLLADVAILSWSGLSRELSLGILGPVVPSIFNLKQADIIKKWETTNKVRASYVNGTHATGLQRMTSWRHRSCGLGTGYRRIVVVRLVNEYYWAFLFLWSLLPNITYYYSLFLVVTRYRGRLWCYPLNHTEIITTYWLICSRSLSDFSTKYGSEKSSKQLVIIVGAIIAVLLIVAFIFTNFIQKK